MRSVVGCLADFLHELDLTAAEFAGDFFTKIAVSDSQFFFAVRAVGVEGIDDEFFLFRFELKPALTMFATDGLADVLSVDAQFPLTIRALDEVSAGGEFDHTSELLQFEERGDLDAVGFQIGIENGTTANAADQVFRHILAAARTGASGPTGHGLLFWRGWK